MLCEDNSIYFQTCGDIALVITIGEGGWLENLVAGEKYFVYPLTTVKISMHLASQNIHNNDHRRNWAGKSTNQLLFPLCNARIKNLASKILNKIGIIIFNEKFRFIFVCQNFNLWWWYLALVMSSNEDLF